MNKNKNSGQIALIILLIMVVVVTVGLAVASRSVTDMRISQNEKEALRAFNAAEAGIEEFLKRDVSALVGGTTETVDVGELKANVTAQATGENTTQKKEKGETMTVYLRTPPAAGTAGQIIFNWTDETLSDEITAPAALEIIIYSYVPAESPAYSIRRFVYNPNGAKANCIIEDYASASAGDGDFYSRASVTVTTNDVLVRARPLCNKATIRVNSNAGFLPNQGVEIISTAKSEGNKVGAVTAQRSLPALLPIFDYILFSGSDINKN